MWHTRSRADLPERQVSAGQSDVSREGLDDPFWNARFGAATPLTELGDETGVAAYFDRGRTLLRSAVRGG